MVGITLSKNQEAWVFSHFLYVSALHLDMTYVIYAGIMSITCTFNTCNGSNICLGHSAFSNECSSYGHSLLQFVQLYYIKETSRIFFTVIYLSFLEFIGLMDYLL